ncbi:Long-chain-fatty-acid-CoA ligase [Phytophthora cinnamomi]|uniref:Long-chain-fatty-acid-CoA ligase n=1 Tax=Phytophthora cinnamomi TaxID=4785 RepID=UPI0035594832|nr:Long-chain-fatty-acid-CoA ligase [Phytophthora cinnamomi]
MGTHGRHRLLERRRQAQHHRPQEEHLQAGAGEYVASEKIENTYSKCKHIAQLFVYGDALQSCLVSVVVPDVEVLKVWTQEHGLNGDDASKAKVLANPEYQKDVRDDTERVTKAAQLRVVERVHNVHFNSKPFSSDDGLVTPTFKLKRPQLKAYFQPQIDEL